MGEADPELERLKEVLEGQQERELKARMLGDTDFFMKTPERRGFLLRWFLQAQNPDAYVYFAAGEALNGLIEGGAAFLEPDLARIKEAAKGEDCISKQRAASVLKMMRCRLEREDTQRLRALLFSDETAWEQKIRILECSDHIASRRENVDVLVEFISGEECDEELFMIGLGTYMEINKDGKGMHITDAQLSYMAGALNSISPEKKERGEKIYEIAAMHAPGRVLEHPGIPEEKKVALLGEGERFTSDMPRSVSVLVDFMLDSELCIVNERIRQAARGTFRGLLEGGLLLTDYHVKRVIGTMVADPSLDILQAEQRENAFWMFRQLVLNGFEIPRNHQGRIMKAAGEAWPKAKDEQRKVEWRLKKLYALKAAELILTVWLIELKERNKTGWPFRPEDRALICYDTSHEDREIRDAAIRVDALADQIDELVSAEETTEIGEALLRKARDAEDILSDYAGEAGGVRREGAAGLSANAGMEEEKMAAAWEDADDWVEMELVGAGLADEAQKPKGEGPGPEGKAPAAACEDGLEREAREAVLDKPGLPPEMCNGRRNALGTGPEVAEKRPSPEKAPAQGGKKG